MTKTQAHTLAKEIEERGDGDHGYIAAALAEGLRALAYAFDGHDPAGDTRALTEFSAANHFAHILFRGKPDDVKL